MKKRQYILLVTLILCLSISGAVIPGRVAIGINRQAQVFGAGKISGMKTNDKGNSLADNAATVESATDIHVAASGMVTNSNAQLAWEGRIRGRVTDTRNNPLKGIQVAAYTDADNTGAWSTWATTMTDRNGAYTVEGLMPDGYRIEFLDYADRFTTEYYQNAATIETARTIMVNDNIIEHIDAQLVGPTGQIQGVVTNESDELLSEADIAIYQDDDQNNVWEWLMSDVTDANGVYMATGLRDGAYRVQFFDQVDQYRYCPFLRYAIQYYPNVETLAAARDVVIQSGNTITNINARLAPAGQIRGRVTDLNNNPISWLWVIARSSDTSSSYCFGSLTGSNGAYTIGVADEVYRLFFVTRIGYSPYVAYTAEYYDNAASFEAATDIPVVNRSIVTDINAQLAPAGTIRGLVSDGNGNWLSQIQVTAYQNVNGQWQPFAITATDVAGAYALPGVGGDTPHGATYRVSFVDLRTPPQYHSKVYYADAYPENGQDIHVAMHEEVWISKLSLEPFDSINFAPLARDDQILLFQDGTTNLWPSVESVLTNDREAEADPMRAGLVDNPDAGAVTLHEDGTFIYTPNSNGWVSDTFTYRARDQTLDSNLATVTILPGVGRLFLPLITR